MSFYFSRTIYDSSGTVVMIINKSFETEEDLIKYEDFYERKIQKLSNEQIHKLSDFESFEKTIGSGL